jgi:hypothetical protein
MPKNQNLGLGRILAGTAQAGMQGAQGVYDTATADYMQAQKIEEMQRAKEQRAAQQEAINQVAQSNPQLGQVLKAYPQAAAGVLEKMYTQKEAKPRETAFAPNGQLVFKDTGDPVTQTSFAAPVKPNEPPSSIQEYEYAKKQGYGGSFKQFQEELKKAGATSINMPSESERTAGFLTGRLQTGIDQITKIITKNPNAASPKLGAEAVRYLTGSDYLKNLTNPEARQQIENAQLEVLDSALTLGTGAAYTREQLQNYSKSYFPQLGDKPQTIKDKQTRLESLLNAARNKSGRAVPQGVGLPANVTVERVQ